MLRNTLAGVWFSSLAFTTTLATLLVALPAGAATFSFVEPTRISAGTFYNGTALRVRGSVGEWSQVVVRVTGESRPETFDRQDRIGGLIWGGVEHVTIRNAPSVYGLYSSTALAATADRIVREQLGLGYEALVPHIEVVGARAPKHLMIEHFVRLKEEEGLYRLASGAVQLEDAQDGRRNFRVDVTLPAATPPGHLEVAVLEFAGGALVAGNRTTVLLERVGMPAHLFRLAHESGVLFGFLAVAVLLTTGLGMGALGRWRPLSQRVPMALAGTELADALAVAAPRPGRLATVARKVGGLMTVQYPATTLEDVARLRAKYRLFRTLLTLNNELLHMLSEVEEESSWTSFHHPRVRMGIRALFDGTADMVRVLNELTRDRYFDLANVVASVRADVSAFLAKVPERADPRLSLQMGEISSKTASMAGGKAVNLARIEEDLGLRVPASFVVTTGAYRLFLEHEGLASELRTVLAPARLDAPDDFRRRSELAQGLIDAARVPGAIHEAIRQAHAACGVKSGEGVAVRSSAAGEDSELSFAGQFETVLNVPESELADAWKQVIRSRFSPRAVFYRRAAGLAEVDTPMAVLVQRMVDARASGVLYTRRPDDPKAPVLLVSAARGLGQDVSTGIASADQFVVSRTSPRRILERRIARKAERLVGVERGGVTLLQVEAEEQLQASISDEEALALAEMSLRIERYFGVPQDIEWAADRDGQIFILQARPLRTERADTGGAGVPPEAPLLLQGEHVVWAGRAVGPVYIARNREEEEQTPIGALLVVPQLLPDCVRILPRVCGIVAERGTVTGHAASIVREFRVPSLFGVAGALEHLVPGQVVSLDAVGRRIYAGALWPELRGHLPVTLLGRRTLGLPGVLAGKLTKLSGSSFLGTWACQSLHDVIRFAHQKAIEAMFNIGDRLLGSPVGGVKRLEAPPQIYMHLVDLGGGILPEAAARQTVKPEEVVSIPFQGLWRGLGDEEFEVRRFGAPSRSFLSVMTGALAAGGPRELGTPNYACVTDCYLNLNSRQAYHYAIVDAFLSENQNNNHISMRVRGGGAEMSRRALRVEFMAEVLRRHHFTVDVTGDLLNGWVGGLDIRTGVERLAMIGHLQRFIAQLDMWMADEAHMRQYIEAFMEAEAEAQRSAGRTGPESSRQKH